MTKVVVSHPHAAAFANEVAASLGSAGLLARYFTGVAGEPGTRAARLLTGLGGRWPRLENRILPDLDGTLAPLWGVELSARALARVLPGTLYDALFVAHDVAVSSCPWPPEAGAIYAYEDGALRSFRRAKAMGMACIWDLPIPYWPTIEARSAEESRRWPGAMGSAAPRERPWKKRRKDAELELADAVCVASRFTRESLEAVGCTKPMFEVAYGFPVDRFQLRTRRPDGPFTVLAVGTQNLRKGTPYLLEAWRRVGLEEGRLRLVGPMKLSESFLAPYRGTFEHVPHLPRSALPAEYAAADVLAFPTLGDGFGLVIQEAMCCGTPVVTTRCGGGPECIDDGENGWIVPERSVHALAERIAQAARDRETTWRVGMAARRKAEQWTWRDARRAVVAGVTKVLNT